MIQIKDTSAQDRQIKRRRRFPLAWISGAVLVLAGAGALWPSFQDYRNSEHSVSRQRLRLATVQLGPYVRDISVNGRAVAAFSPTLYSPAEGIAELAVAAGDVVSKDQVVVEIVSPELRNRWQQESASLSSLKVESERQAIDARQEALRLQQTVDLAAVSAQAAQREVERARRSWEKQLISEQDYERRQDELASAQLALSHARQDAGLANDRLSFETRASALAVERQQLVVDELQRQLDALQVRAPVSGVVGDLQIRPRDAVALNQALLSVVDLTALEIELDVPESYAEELSPGMDITLSYSGQDYPAQLRAISPEVNNNEVKARARFVDELPNGLKQNQRLSARIVLEAKDNALIVERGSFLENGNGRVAYVVEGNLAQRRNIQIGAISIAQVEILAGLNPGDTIIVSNTNSFDGAQQVLLND